MTASTFTATPEQNEALALFNLGEDLVIEAGAGTGKTSTLVLLAQAAMKQGRQGQYVAFNKAIVTDASEKMPANVRCNTAHALAFRAVGVNYKQRLNTSGRMKSWELAKILRIQGFTVQTFTGDEKWLAPTFLAGLVMRGVTNFCQSADPAPSARHIPYIEGIDHPGSAERPRTYHANNEVAERLVPVLRRAWDDIRQYRGALPFKHEHYLKIWQLSRPTIAADFIMFDEAQDASPVMLAVVEDQTHAQVVYVGDSNQAIYEFTGAVNALAKVQAPSRSYLTQSFRFGPAVANVANKVLAQLPTPLRLTGLETIASVVGAVVEPDCILTRTNAQAVRTALGAMKQGTRVALVGGSTEIVSFARAASRLMNGERVEHPELACFANWSEVQEYVDQDEQGGDLKLMVDLVEEFTVDTILAGLSETVDEARADLIVSTAHKSKGREWAAVQIAGDFQADITKVSESEWRLLYVAATRARRELDVTACTVLSGLLTGAAV